LTPIDVNTANLFVTILAAAIPGSVAVTFFLTRWMYTERRRQSTDRDILNDIARELIDSIKCIKRMKEEFSDEVNADSTSPQDKDFYKRLIAELDKKLKKYNDELIITNERMTQLRQ
jgi:site-specific DNA-adenine methylase